MIDAERRALRALSFNWAPTQDDVWRFPPYHVDGLHPQSEQIVLDGLEDAELSDDASPIGVALLGLRGTGKTHLLGWVREQTQARGGYFFLISLLDTGAFWRSVALSMVDGLTREVPGYGTQLKAFLTRLADDVQAPRSVRRAVTGETELSRAALDAFLDAVRKKHPQVVLQCRDTARALVLRSAEEYRLQCVGDNFLCTNDEEEPGERAAWGIRSDRRSAQEIVREMSHLLALTGPTVIAIDQIDILVAQSSKGDGDGHQEEWRETLLFDRIGDGLMSLREWTRRTLSVVSCLPWVWERIKAKATDTVQDRFREATRLQRIPTPDLGRQLIERRFAERFAKAGFTAPYPTWPVLASAFGGVVGFTPRDLLKTVDTHVRRCLLAGEVEELASLSSVDMTAPAAMSEPALPAHAIADLDTRFAELRAGADISRARASETEDGEVPELLSAGLTAWIAEHDPEGRTFSQDPPPGAKPALHARLRRSLDDDREDEEHYAFRAIVADHHLAALNRLRNARTAAGLVESGTKRRLFLLRGEEWNRGPKTQEVVRSIHESGGATLPFPDEDIRILAALRELIRKEGAEALRPWFAARRPAREISVLNAALADPASTVVEAVTTDSISVGATVALEALRKHIAIFAGSGSGKTVLIRRLVEECALQGVSAIVLDPNNDLARLGDPWPEPPAHWGPGDAAKAEEYHRHTDVVVWTPRRDSGRPLSFQPLPDFSGMLNDPDEFAIAVDAAVAALAPRAKVDGAAAKATHGKAVLKEALTHFARRGRSDLRGFVDLLSELPDGLSTMDNAGKLAADMAQTLKAVMVTDPLFGGAGTPVDPGVLLTPPAGKRARISVISLIGLPSDDQRQSFVNQLQLALFAWIKRHPAGDRPLGGLFIMDEAQTLAPSGAMTACTESTLALASQARKYGLGLVFATQAPKGLHNRIPGNAATQFFGLLNHPTQIAAARELARAKGSDVSDIAMLGTGQFYAAVEGSAFQKIQAPLCLSHHPKSPLTVEEVLDRARHA